MDTRCSSRGLNQLPTWLPVSNGPDPQGPSDGWGSGLGGDTQELSLLPWAQCQLVMSLLPGL